MAHEGKKWTDFYAAESVCTPSRSAQEYRSAIRTKNYNVPLIRNTEIIERPADQNTITKRYYEEAVSYI